MNKYALSLAVGCVMIVVALTGCAGDISAQPMEQPSQSTPAPDGLAPAMFTTEQRALANPTVEQLRTETSVVTAAMTVTSYANYIAVFEADTTRTSHALSDDSDVIVVAVNGSVSTANIKWAPDAGEIPEARGTVVGMDGSGKLISRLVLFEASHQIDNPQATQTQGAVERLADLGTEVVPLG